jgi:hypothetical protein
VRERDCTDVQKARADVTSGASNPGRATGASWKRRLLILTVAIVGIPVLFYILATAYVVFVPSAEDYAHRTEFDPTVWRDKSLDGEALWPTRLRMADDLIADKRLDGLTRVQVESLLGPGDRADKWQGWHLVYHLGPERGMIRIDSEWLVIRFDPSDRVDVYRIVRD